MSIKALIIGCGNIGALYDLDAPEKVWTHAKAFSRFHEIDFKLSDANTDLLLKVCKHYDVEHISISDGFDYSQFDIVSITTPTPSHFYYLRELLIQNVSVVLCEKPVAATESDLNDLLLLYKQSKSRVFVNYIRRFQPEFSILKTRLIDRNSYWPFTGIIIKYQRGFLNNAGHAFDLLEYLFGCSFLFDNFQVQSVVFDAFPYDPTLTGTCNFQNIPVNIVGISEADYPIFEIELFSSNGKIVICHSGDEIRYYHCLLSGSSLVEDVSLRQSNIRTEYMLPIVRILIESLSNPNLPDNFQQATLLNKRMTQILSNIAN